MNGLCLYIALLESNPVDSPKSDFTSPSSSSFHLWRHQNVWISPCCAVLASKIWGKLDTLRSWPNDFCLRSGKYSTIISIQKATDYKNIMHCHGHLKTGGVESGLDLDQRIHFRARIILHAEFRTMFFWFRTTPATLLYETKVKIHIRISELILWFPINTLGEATCTMCIRAQCRSLCLPRLAPRWLWRPMRVQREWQCGRVNSVNSGEIS